MAFDRAPHFAKTLIGEAGDEHDRRRPVRRRRRQDTQRARIFGGRLAGARGIDVGLVDRHHIRLFDDAPLDALELVAGARQGEHEEEVGHVGDRGFRLADADRLDQQDVEARRLAKDHRLAGSRGDASQRSGGRRRTDEGVGISREPRHPRLVAEDRAAGRGPRPDGHPR